MSVQLEALVELLTYEELEVIILGRRFSSLVLTLISEVLGVRAAFLTLLIVSSLLGSLYTFIQLTSGEKGEDSRVAGPGETYLLKTC